MTLLQVKLWQPYAYFEDSKIANYYIFTNRTEKYVSYYVFSLDNKTYYKTNLGIGKAWPRSSTNEYSLVPIFKEMILILFEYKVV